MGVRFLHQSHASRRSGQVSAGAGVTRREAMKILFASSEALPFAKTGGLADVSGALPKALARLGLEVTLILPKYRQVDEKRFPLRKIFT